MTDNSTDNIENNYHKSEETPRPSQNEHIITSEPALEKEDSTHSKNSHKLTSQNNFEDQQQNQNEVFTENFQKDQAQNKNKFNDYYRMLNPKINSTAYHSTLKLVLDISSNAIRAVKYVKKSNVKDLEKFREMLKKNDKVPEAPFRSRSFVRTWCLHSSTRAFSVHTVPCGPWLLYIDSFHLVARTY